jgi:biotin transporter BioY
MYIIAIGWLWVALMMAITEANAVAGILSFVFYGLLPCALLLWLLGTPARRRRRAQDEEEPPAA